MRRFIFGERDGIYIIDLLKTERLLETAQAVRRRARRAAAAPSCSSAPRSRPATPIKEVAEAAGMPYVNQRWLGGLLTNFQTITQRIKRLHELERYETEGQLDAAADARAHRRAGRAARSSRRTSAASRTCSACPTRCS